MNIAFYVSLLKQLLMLTNFLLFRLAVEMSAVIFTRFFFRFSYRLSSLVFRRITGLDPAAPLYLKWSYDAIRISDAPFVDIIHTNGERLGESWAR